MTWLSALHLGHYELEVIIRILLAALAGGLIGLEREKHGRPAGLRTHLLVTVGSCLMMVVSEAFFIKYGDVPGTSVVRLDPARIAAQIVTGIGFLGAGVILKEGISVRGLTTAACLWLVAGIGMSIGMGLYFPAILSTVLALLSLMFLKKLEPFIGKDRYLKLSVLAFNREAFCDDLEALFAEMKLRVSDLEMVTDLEHDEVRIDVVVTNHHRRIGKKMTAAISKMPGVKKVSFR